MFHCSVCKAWELSTEAFALGMVWAVKGLAGDCVLGAVRWGWGPDVWNRSGDLKR